jgi:hypothetical protein
VMRHLRKSPKERWSCCETSRSVRYINAGTFGDPGVSGSFPTVASASHVCRTAAVSCAVVSDNTLTCNSAMTDHRSCTVVPARTCSTRSNKVLSLCSSFVYTCSY